MKRFMIPVVVLIVLGMFGWLHAQENETKNKTDMMSEDKYEVATFAGGCFWCMQPPFDALDGVVKTTVGFTGGTEKNPTYKEVSYGQTGHAESIEIVYDPSKITYDQLLDVYWMNIDPTDSGGQFVDRGKQYRPEIFYHNESQKKTAEASRKKLAESGRFDKPIVVQITKAPEFYPAEEYHQKFYKKDKLQYKAYRWGSGRDQFIKKHWGKESASH